MRLALALLLLASACSVAHRVDVFPMGAPKHWTCLDGLPVRTIQDVRCLEGICGVTCAPDRWSGDRCP